MKLLLQLPEIEVTHYSHKLVQKVTRWSIAILVTHTTPLLPYSLQSNVKDPSKKITCVWFPWMTQYEPHIKNPPPLHPHYPCLSWVSKVPCWSPPRPYNRRNRGWRHERSYSKPEERATVKSVCFKDWKKHMPVLSQSSGGVIWWEVYFLRVKMRSMWRRGTPSRNIFSEAHL